MKKLIIMFLALAFTASAAYAEKYVKPIGDQIGMERPHYKISVTQNGKALGDITIELFPDVAPLHVKNFDELVTSKAFDGTAFHRVIPGFMIQGGDPNSKTNPDMNTWGMGAPGQKMVNAEFSKLSHKRGILSAARRGDNINSATSQFFICVDDASASLDGQYSIYGQVVTGMEVVDMIVNTPKDGRDHPNAKVEMHIVKIKK